MEPFERMSPEERKEEMRAAGLDPDAVVRDVRADFARITKEYKQRTLRAMQAAHEESVRKFMERQSRVPTDLPAMQAMYARLAQSHPLTVQHRDLSAVSPEELRQLLEQLDALGLVPDDES
jgi:hypothetical protein